MTTNWFNVEADNPHINIMSAPGQHGHEEETTTALIEQMLQLVAADPSLPSRRVYDQVKFLIWSIMLIVIKFFVLLFQVKMNITL